MTALMEQRVSNGRGRGWLVVAIVSGFVLLSAIYPLVVPVDESDFEGETGVVWAEFQTEEPAVADYLAREARAVAVAAIGFAALALGLAAGPLRQGEASAWRVLWIFPAALTLIAVVFLLSGGVIIGVMYLVLVGLTVLGLLLSRSHVTAGSTPPQVPTRQ